jgi:hypothetical protein
MADDSGMVNEVAEAEADAAPEEAIVVFEKRKVEVGVSWRFAAPAARMRKLLYVNCK